MLFGRRLKKYIGQKNNNILSLYSDNPEFVTVKFIDFKRAKYNTFLIKAKKKINK